MRTDEELRHDVTAELDWDPSVDAGRIDVEVHHGVVKLVGVVESHGQKCRVEAAALRICGVRGVMPELDVELPDALRRPDGDIAEAAHNVLAWNALVPAASVQVAVRHGRLLLSGSVEWAYQKRAAEDALRNLVGLRSLVNLVEINPGVEPRDTTRQIGAALRRRNRGHAGNLSVMVNGGTVTLSGQLGCWSERDAVRQTAWNAPGIRKVVDETTIAACP